MLGEGGKLVSTVSDPKRNRDCSIQFEQSNEIRRVLPSNHGWAKRA